MRKSDGRKLHFARLDSSGDVPAERPPGALGRASKIGTLDIPQDDQVRDADRQSDLTLMFTMTGSVIPRISGMCVGCSLIGCVGLYAIEKTGVVFNDYLHKVVVMPLGFLLVFRSNLAYGRFWESRGHVGTILRLCRQIACKVGAKCLHENGPGWPRHQPSAGHSGTAPGGVAPSEPTPRRGFLGRAAWGASASSGGLSSSVPASPAASNPGAAAGGGQHRLNGDGGSPGPGAGPYAAAAAAAGASPGASVMTPGEVAEEMQRLLMLLYYVIVHTLRQTDCDPSDEFITQLTPAEAEELSQVAFKPIVVVRWALQHLQAVADQGVLSWWEHQLLISHLDHITEAAVGAHKVASTPIPFPYTQMLSWLVYVFIFTVPLTIATAYAGDGFGDSPTSPSNMVMVAISSAVIAFALTGINETATELEAPFGFDPNDIPLGRLGEGMEVDTTTMLCGLEAARELKRKRTMPGHVAHY